MSVSSTTALILACIVAPVVGVTVGSLAFFADQLDGGEYTLGWFGAAMIGCFLGVVVGIPAMLLVGLPLHGYFQRRGMTGLFPYAIGGALAGVLGAITFLVAPPTTGWQSWSDMGPRLWDLVVRWEVPARVLAFSALSGLISALLFRVLVRLRPHGANPATSAQ